MSEMAGTKETSWSGMGDEWDAEYIAVLRDLEPAGTAEFSEKFGVGLDSARRRLKRIQEVEGSPVESKKIGGSHVWFVDESKLDASAASAADEIRRRMGVEEKQ